MTQSSVPYSVFFFLFSPKKIESLDVLDFKRSFLFSNSLKLLLRCGDFSRQEVLELFDVAMDVKCRCGLHGIDEPDPLALNFMPNLVLEI